MRGTIHLVTADDALALPAVFQPVLDAEIARHPEFAPHLRGADLAPVLAYAREVLSAQPATTTRLRAAIAEQFPAVHAAAAAYATRCYVPLVQVPPRGVWGKKGQVTVTPARRLAGPAPRHGRRARRARCSATWPRSAPPPWPTPPPGAGSPACARWSTAWRPGCGPSATSGAARSTTSPTAPCPTRTWTPRSGSCPSTTTRPCPSRTAAASGPTGTAASRVAATRSRAACWSTAGSGRSGTRCPAAPGVVPWSASPTTRSPRPRRPPSRRRPGAWPCSGWAPPRRTRPRCAWSRCRR